MSRRGLHEALFTVFPASDGVWTREGSQRGLESQLISRRSSDAQPSPFLAPPTHTRLEGSRTRSRWWDCLAFRLSRRPQ